MLDSFGLRGKFNRRFARNRGYPGKDRANMIRLGFSAAPFPRGKSRLLFGAGLFILAALLFSAMAFWGATRTWDMLGVPYMVPNFADARVITAGAESASHGFDPLIANPADPYGHRPMNYPRIWQLLFYLGLSQRHTALLAGIFIGFFLLGLMLVMGDASGLAVLVQLACLTSPAVGLCLERGNNDLFVFFVVALAVFVLEHRPWLSAALVGFGFLLKLYPLAALAMFCGRERKNRWLIVGALGLGASAYLLLQHKEIHAIWMATPINHAWSYGGTFLIEYFLHTNGTETPLTEATTLLAFAVLVGSAGKAAWQWPAGALRSSLQLTAFRAGAAIYAITFFVQPSCFYRLIFLLLVIPQLVEWVQAHERRRSYAAGITLLAAMIGMWALRLPSIWISLPGGVRCGWLFVQSASWVLFFGLAYLEINTVIDPRPEQTEAPGMSIT